MSQYTEHLGKFDFSSQHFPVPLSSVGSFATTNKMSINVYGVGDLSTSRFIHARSRYTCRSAIV